MINVSFSNRSMRFRCWFNITFSSYKSRFRSLEYFLSVEGYLADIYDNKKMCRKSSNDYNDSCYPDQKIQMFQEMSSPKRIDPYLKILEEPGDTRFRYFRLKNCL